MRFVKHIAMICAAFTIFAPAAGAATGESSLLAAMNQARAEHGLRPLRLDATLARAARAHSLDELRHGYFAHGAFVARLTAFGARGPMVGENLAWGEGDLGSAGHVVAMWLASPEHRANLLRPGYTRVGLATPIGSFQGVGDVAMVTADFAGK
jgi:uncharacterized protein YkwD